MPSASPLLRTRETVAMLVRIAKEPPFRLLARALVRHLPFSVQTKALWDAVTKPNYLTGVLYAANQAVEEKVPEISVIEFGVAGGNGLLALQDYAAAAEKESGIRISVWGFDTGKGLSQPCGDYRDHPDRYVPGEYSMDEKVLTRRLHPRTKLILGDVSKTVVTFVGEASYPRIGFVSIDLDLYSSSKGALQVLALPGRRMLRRVPLYFDDIDSSVHHDWAGELLAIREFNNNNASVKIDRWRGIEYERPFGEHGWLKRMYMAHDLAALSSTASSRGTRQLPLAPA
jgi:hypothetical protein